MSATPGVFSVSMFYPENTDTLMEAYKLLAKTNLGALIVASGNEGSNSTIALYPQHMPPFMGVGMLSSYMIPAHSSNFGKHVQLYGPGFKVLTRLRNG